MPARMTWVYAPAKPKKPSVPEAERLRAIAAAEELIAEFRPLHVKPPPEEACFNYISGLYTKWRQNYVYLCATYACPGPNALSPSFEAPFTRLEYVGRDSYNLAYMRYTGKWQEVYCGLSLSDAVDIIRGEALFHPL